MNLLLLSVLLISSALAAALDIAKGEVENDFAKRPADLKSFYISVIDEATAMKLFHELAGDADIPFAYGIRDCQARATEMGELAEREGILTARLYVSGQFYVTSRTFPTAKPHIWNWHVAPTVYVRHASGEIEMMVLDPSLLFGPATLDQWFAVLVAVPKNSNLLSHLDAMDYGARFQYLPPWQENGKTAWYQHDVDAARYWDWYNTQVLLGKLPDAGQHAN